MHDCVEAFTRNTSEETRQLGRYSGLFKVREFVPVKQMIENITNAMMFLVYGPILYPIEFGVVFCFGFMARVAWERLRNGK